MRLSWSLLAIAAALGGAPPSAACIAFPPLRQLPGEDGAAYRLRATALLAAQHDEERRRWQQAQFDQAAQVFLARVVVADRGPGRTIRVQPLRAFKGRLPQADVAVRDVRSASCQTIVGGERRSAAAGDHLILFVEATTRGAPGWTREIPIHEARDPRLLAAIASF